ncbi:serine/threonine-protein kinase LMTK1-like isoform X2 [Mya arenaria]|uniref:serine/threonine-protein kinase LMTK1-like isoform X2 n=1 Tax=Mya arenaria TaxID=6604 RepID=UPI0022E8EA69|nr:serine/threonine-protein kinase LMTK1-like isoform X2 [Mya arenaria]
MVIVAALMGVAVLCCSVLLVFGCVCHLFKRRGFTNFEDDVEGGRNVSMYSSHDNPNDVSDITFEPLPDILAKTVSKRALRPRITCTNPEKQTVAANAVTVYKPFPRNQLLYIKEIGLGWFGQVLQGSAEGISPDMRQSKVVVKILKDDASANEKSLFLEEVAPYRDLDHPNILQLLGQCTETSPFLTVLEFPPLGDLKTYMFTNKTGPFIQFAIDAACGLACMHKHSYVHHDFAARNCMVMGDLQVKIGDYNIGEDLFREDYYDTGRDLLPIRWMSPEILEVKHGIWQAHSFTVQSNVWSLSILLWEILSMGRKPYSWLLDEDVLLKVVKEGSVKLPPPNTDIPLHDRWFEVMEMCWQEADDRPSTEDILAFLQQIEEEMTAQSHDTQHSAQTNQNTPVKTPVQSPSFDSKFVMSKNINQSNQHLAEVLVHRADNKDVHGFEDDFSKDVTIRKNQNPVGFEDDFVSGSNLNVSEAAQNDSIIAGSGSPGGQSADKDIFAADHNLNLLQPPVPVRMSTPSKPFTPLETNGHSSAFNTANSNLQQSDSNFITANDGAPSSNIRASNDNSVQSNDENGSELQANFTQSVSTSSKASKKLFEEKSETHNSDDGYRTGVNGSTPDIVLSPNNKELKDVEEKLNDDSGTESIPQVSKLSPKAMDLETEKAKEIYMSKGLGLPTSIMHRSRSLGTIPEDEIPSDNTSQTGVFDDNEDTDVGMNFEWDDFEGEQLVGRVRYMSEDSSGSMKSPRHVEVEEWPFDQDSGSDANSKPGSIASDSDAEVTRLSIDSNTSIDTRARIASILSNRLNSLIKQSNSNTPRVTTGKSMFYSFADDEYDLDSPENALSETEHSLDKAPFSYEPGVSLGMPTVQEEVEEPQLPVESTRHGQYCGQSV